MQRAATRAAADRSAARPLVEWGDLAFALRLALLAPVALLVPERRWHAIGRALSRRFRTRHQDSLLQPVRSAVAVRPELPPEEEILCEVYASRLDVHLQMLREFLPRRWRPDLRVRGLEHLRRALEAGKGAVLWVGPQVFNGLVVKKGLAEAGVALAHLSNTTHGPRRSELGVRFLNRVWVSRENRYLAHRILMGSRSQLAASRELDRQLRANLPVTISCIPPRTEARRYACLGGELGLSTGPATMALARGSALIPVFVARSEPARYEVILEDPLEVPEGARGRAAATALADAYARRVEVHAAADPSAFQWWTLYPDSWNLEP